MHLIESDLELKKEFDIRRLKEIDSYKGWRHTIGLPVRGQKTKSSFRSGGKIGVSRARIQDEAEPSGDE
jgi:small subunit ribosomal protein S13